MTARQVIILNLAYHLLCAVDIVGNKLNHTVIIYNGGVEV